ncbi:uncharacterized protein [Montipora foliosa]|uniref:uncharacterized protein n=1 Tax=Montipora foliosa TaxID=591990 RepID=UPI0035F124B3
MVTAAPSFSSTKETTNYARLCRLLVDVGTQALRDTFNRIHPPTRLHGILASELPTLRSLRNRRILNATQWGKLYPTIPSAVSSASFDITLLMVLLRNICGLSAPASTGSWDVLPLASDNSIVANVARIKYYRNNVYGHATQASIDEPTFHVLWLEISNALLALVSSASYTSAISQLMTDCMDPDVEEHYCELLKQWKKDDDNTKDKLEKLEEMMKTNDVRTQDKLNEIQETLKTYGVPTQDKLKEIQVPQFSGRRLTRLSSSTVPKNVGAKGASRKRGATSESIDYGHEKEQLTSEAINDTTVVKTKAAKPNIPVPAAPLVLKVIARGIRKCAGCSKHISKVIPGYDAEQDRTMCFGRFEPYTYWNEAKRSSKVAKSVRHYHLNPVCTDIQNGAVNIDVGDITPDDNLRALLLKRFNYDLP